MFSFSLPKLHTFQGGWEEPEVKSSEKFCDNLVSWDEQIIINLIYGIVIKTSKIDFMAKRHESRTIWSAIQINRNAIIKYVAIIGILYKFTIRNPVFSSSSNIMFCILLSVNTPLEVQVSSQK